MDFLLYNGYARATIKIYEDNMKGVSKLKRLISMIFTLLLVISISSPTSASTNHLHLDNHEQESENIKGEQEQGGDFGAYYIPCEVTGGKHQMKPRGIGRHTLTNGSTFNGNLYQCIGCRMTVTTYYNYFNDGERPNGPGKYIVASAPVFVDNAGYFFSGKYTLSGPATSWFTGVFASMAFSY